MNNEFLQAYSAACLASYAGEVQQHRLLRPERLSGLGKIRVLAGQLLLQLGHRLEAPADYGHDVRRRYV